jgi:hypothetical protein
VKKSNRGDAEAAETAKKSKEIIVRYRILCGLSDSALRLLIFSQVLTSYMPPLKKGLIGPWLADKMFCRLPE